MLNVPEILTAEVRAWVKREAPTSREFLMDALGQHLAVGRTAPRLSRRQLYRYLSGETPFPAERAPAFCRAVGSHRLLLAVNQEAGLLLAEPIPDPGRLDGYDLVDEQNANFREFSEYAAAFAEALRAPPSKEALARVEKEGREAIQQAHRLIAIYRGIVNWRRAA